MNAPPPNAHSAAADQGRACFANEKPAGYEGRNEGLPLSLR